jgi:hypothetical protein
VVFSLSGRIQAEHLCTSVAGNARLASPIVAASSPVMWRPVKKDVRSPCASRPS